MKLLEISSLALSCPIVYFFCEKCPYIISTLMLDENRTFSIDRRWKISVQTVVSANFFWRKQKNKYPTGEIPCSLWQIGSSCRFLNACPSVRGFVEKRIPSTRQKLNFYTPPVSTLLVVFRVSYFVCIFRPGVEGLLVSHDPKSQNSSLRWTSTPCR